MTLADRKTALIQESQDIEQEAQARSLSVQRVVQAHNVWLREAEARQNQIKGAIGEIDLQHKEAEERAYVAQATAELVKEVRQGAPDA